MGAPVHLRSCSLARSLECTIRSRELYVHLYDGKIRFQVIDSDSVGGGGGGRAHKDASRRDGCRAHWVRYGFARILRRGTMFSSLSERATGGRSCELSGSLFHRWLAGSFRVAHTHRLRVWPLAHLSN